MKSKILYATVTLFCILNTSCQQNSNQVVNENGKILKVPSEFSTIREAIKKSAAGDWIILAPGSYFEQGIDIDKAVTISSEWKLSGDELMIDKTIIDSHDSILFNIKSDGVEVSGLKIVNGDHPLNITANATIKYNHFFNDLDAISFEGSGGGYAGYNTMENDRDDGIDLDIRFGGPDKGSNIVIEHNTIINSNDDGIEIRLYQYPDQNINYTIRSNRISGSKNAGIQIISYDIFTGKAFRIHHNIISGCKTGVGCMEGSNSREDMSGASKMDELVWLYNNTLTGNQVGATGGNRVIAFNNLVSNNSVAGFKRFGQSSFIRNNLFYNNGGSDMLEVNPSAKTDANILLTDPLVDSNTFSPLTGSPCINAGLAIMEVPGEANVEISPEYITGSAPDIGAVEHK